MKKILIIMLIQVFLGTYAAANPNINSISGIIVNGQSLIISGSGFGNKPKPTPFVFLKENIESGIPGAAFAAPGWTSSPESGGLSQPIYNDTEAYSGNRSIRFKFIADKYTSWISYDTGTGFDRLYYTAWIKIVKNDAATRFQWKSMRINDKNQYAVSCSIIEDNWWNSGVGWGNNDIQAYYNGGKQSQVVDSIDRDSYLINQWMRIEGYYKRASGPLQSDGIVWHTRIGKSGTWGDRTSVITHEQADGPWRYIFIGMYYGNLLGINIADRNALVYYDDIYIDNTPARVEIGNNITFSNCTQREIQYPTTWSDSSVTVTLNRGSLDPYQTYYLYVVDADGNVNTNGFPIKIDTEAGNPPRPPTNFQIIEKVPQ